MLRTLGADAVGMSTVLEAIAARWAGIEVCGVSLVTNAGAGYTGQPLTHEEVLEAGRGRPAARPGHPRFVADLPAPLTDRGSGRSPPGAARPGGRTARPGCRRPRLRRPFRRAAMRTAQVTDGPTTIR